ncbi:nucleotidyl transferase domain protein [Leptospira borgpetersenii serovar Pomona str. 200901868]|uniref:Nucleotidyl transferase domain protein n=1 Tax=Leptospira borgpetersenii serovar Pomona str. 200901868 TaxID=1192866 RepID=M6VRY0_LEPBO|nr:nucleotidyl transferase domain protein [Leptospira borgpetersenii serovar Pomona str. 200901868]
MNQDKPIVLIMAGGKGERFWPRSRVSTPKQLQKVYSNKTLLKETLERALTITTIDRVYIGTNASLKKSILSQEKNFPEKISLSNRKVKTRLPSSLLRPCISGKNMAILCRSYCLQTLGLIP